MRCLIAALLCAVSLPARAVETPAPVTIQIAYIGLTTAQPQTSSVLDKLPNDEGVLAALLGLADDKTTGPVSPQPGYVHQTSELDTLGTDQPETTCHFAP